LTNIYPAGEKKISEVNSNRIKTEILKKRSMHVDVINFNSDVDLIEIKNKIELNLCNNDLILIMGAGSISKVPQFLKNAWQ
jgi:UDP-N-acetylmuramate-alanine ligase